MTKKFFTKVSPKAVEGIRRVFERDGAEVHAQLQSDGTAIVVVISPDDGGSSQKRATRQREAA
ncbi:hypothetical protein BSL82_01150 [Tardibacter chloracetimidivorans]|uniref:Uncharacterized protein n=1 Tax=Tardibacter chloracetimidivorans TaxID=1921510 RepID=A0A1L3ZR19_9SPHN|nr:hypothetical protein [Tardibacter chloracetimidivorans]API58072.1 hypothetical protein BSL82_01150 [Tardibacter chloracetimidivorans]